MQKISFLRSTIVTAVALSCAQAALAAEPVYDFGINAPTLDVALREFAAQTGLQIAYFTRSAEGLAAPAVNGRYTAEQALRALLDSSKLRFEKLDGRTIAIHDYAPTSGRSTGSTGGGGQGALLLAQAQAADASADAPAEQVLSEVTVTATRAELYSSRVVTSGVLGDKDPIDIPFAISSYSGELAKLQAAYTPAQILKNDPSAQNQGNFIGYQNNVIIRGFASSLGGVRRDGLIANHEGDFPIETYDRVEVVKGVAGFLYGFAEPGGVLNFVTKRPTREAFADVDVRYLDRTGPYVHLDTGGPMGSERYGYRANLVYQNDGGFRDPDDLRRVAASLAMDARVSDKLLLRFDGSYSDRQQASVLGLPLTSDGSEPPHYDPDNVLTPPWVRSQWASSHFGANADYEISDDWRIKAQVGYEKLVTHINFGYNLSVQPNGDFQQLVINENPRGSARTGETTAQILALGTVHTGVVKHELAFGMFRRHQNYDYFAPSGNGNVLVSSNIHDPAFPDQPAVDGGPRVKADASGTTEIHVFVGDTLHFGEHWQVMAGARMVDANATGEDSDVDKKISPSAALLFKPTEGTTLYGSYARSLQYGFRSPCLDDGVEIVNPCELQPPIQAKQYEVGAKARLTRAMDLGFAAYRIELPSDYLDTVTHVYGRFGEQVNQGIELTAIGNLTSTLAVVAGLGYLDAKRTRNLDPVLDGNRVAGLAKVTANLFVNYGVGAVPGLGLNAGLYRSGSRYLNDLNTVPVAGYTRMDLGAQYRFGAQAKDLTLRLNVNNVFDKFYWEGLGPFAHSYTPAQGRQFILSAQMRLF